MKIYLIKWDNNESYEDHASGNGAAYATKELAEKAISMLEAAQEKRLAKESEEGYMWYTQYSWRIEELEVMTFVSPIEEE